MWQTPGRGDGKKRTQDRNRVPFHMQRTEAELVIGQGASSKKITIRVVLNDFSTKGIGIYGTAAFPVGESIAVHFSKPKDIVVHGRLVWSLSIETSSHILSTSPQYSHRGGIEFIPASAQEEADIQEFCDQLMKELGEINTPKIPG